MKNEIFVTTKFLNRVNDIVVLLIPEICVEGEDKPLSEIARAIMENEKFISCLAPYPKLQKEFEAAENKCVTNLRSIVADRVLHNLNN